MPTERITLKADSIDGAAEQIIHVLEGTDEGRDVMYFHGWVGWGASAVLKAVVKRLRSSPGWADTKIIHIDFSRWQSKRALQKAIAEELELPPQLMAFFDQHEEQDDFDGVEQSARGVIPHVKLAIMNELIAHRFLVVLHNGSGGYIDLWEVGVPVIEQLSKRVLWTSRGRFRPHVTEGHGDEDMELAGLSDVSICCAPSAAFQEDNVAALSSMMRNILHAEAEEVAKYTGVPEPDMSPKIVLECILYRALRRKDHNISWESQASNYWVCDGTIQDAIDGSRSAWEIGDALQRNMNLVLLDCCAKTICQILSGEQWRRTDRWVSVTSKKSTKVQVPSQATSFFWTAAGASIDHNGTTVLDAGLFENSDRNGRLRVIHLSHCTFSFSSPPFLSCSNQRFLLLDHCKDKDAQDHGDEECHHHSRGSQDGGTCFQKLWVLDLSYTDWYWLLSKEMLDLMADLRELNVKGDANQSMNHLHRRSGVESNSRRLLKLQVVADNGAGGDRNRASSVVASFPDLSSWNILKTVILDGCGNLELIDCNSLPPSLESFSFISNVATKIKSISLSGCAKLKSLLLRGLFGSLVELDMSGTAVKTLDLSAMQATGLRQLILLGCEKLCAILWPQEKDKKIRLEVIRIGTSHAAWYREHKSSEKEATSDNIRGLPSSTTVSSGNGRVLTALDSYISLRDPRLFRSLMHFKHAKKLHIEVSDSLLITGGGHRGFAEGINSSACGGSDKQQVQATDLQKPTGNLYIDDDPIFTFMNENSQAGGDVSESEASVIKWKWHCPPIHTAPNCAHCYISVQDEAQTEQETTRVTNLPHFVHKKAETLHLHDSSSITHLPGRASADAVSLLWKNLKWCRLERCPGLEGAVFTSPSPWQQDTDIFQWLQTFWASRLLKARYIWDWGPSLFIPGKYSFDDLVFLHLDYCPRLVHVLPLYASNTHGCRKLETLEIVCCGDLREVFPSDSESPQQEPRKFPSLKRIHLHELSALQRISGQRMAAPSLETVRIRGCWGLKRLPAVLRRSTPPTVDCEKEWWDGLEWDGEEAGHHPSHYKPIHSAYYKEALLTSSVLR